MKVQVSEATPIQLDWMVTKIEAERKRFTIYPEYITSYSTNWSQGGPIIEREEIDLFTEKGTPELWVASVAQYQNGMRLVGWRLHQYGPTPLIAAMRCYVASHLGVEVEIPEELT